ncbi:LOW QUALITY PROTEIN: hypothetical protein MXB_4657 [Myxobolus squamalis]|nr:LOW QUALITY PROTEIN: hypothetical protein MXB_4657 [Myxobolus squamalis]
MTEKHTENIKNINDSKSTSESFPKRYILAGMVFLGFCLLYALRVNINIAINAMVSNHTVNENGFSVTKSPEFNWDSKLQGSFYYGYLVLQIPGGWLAYKFGGTHIFGASLGIASLLTLLTPFLARFNIYVLIGLRICEGLVLGVLFPCNHAIWAIWAPPLERSRLFTITAAGCPVGTIITMPIAGLLSKYGFDGGWASVFYVSGGVGLIWYFVWCMTIHSTPDSHPTISSHEVEHIKSHMVSLKENSSVPWLKILLSPAVWACAIANFCADWGLYTILICIPKFFVDVFSIDIAKVFVAHLRVGFIASIPYVIKAIVGPTGGYLADILISKKISIRNVRRLIYAIGCSTAATFILAVSYTSSPVVAIIFLCIGVGITGLNATGYAVNILDFAPKYAGPIMGLCNVFGSMPGFISPQIVGIVTKEKTAHEWRIIFWITAGVYTIGIFLFSLLVTGEQQPWALSQEESKKSKEDFEEEN